eukprot:CAMPEP_0185745562 /NCGR_PEP_ID=MMETSP1174-20130828/3935_1 /TAXON_ID=35687 /ORGANISM="Dictyocha speculum, Strain CCMP1381" /LENGTH=737 /DNA_ID=CAMNT_0028419661 /DNA_START=59 /DNA_END=2269 /DNA_ORIENTATION=-
MRRRQKAKRTHNQKSGNSSGVTREKKPSEVDASKLLGRNDTQFGVFLVCFSVLLYFNSLRGQLVFDDEPAIVRNADLRPESPWSLLLTHDFWGAPLRLKTSNKSYRPLTVATFKLNYFIHGLSPEGYHLVNIVLHAVVTVLFWRVARIIFDAALCSPKKEAYSRHPAIISRWRAFAAALLFAAHPVHTEAVASVVGRAELLSAALFLLSIMAFHHGSLFGAAAAAGAALVSKEQGIFALPVCASLMLAQRIVGMDVGGGGHSQLSSFPLRPSPSWRHCLLRVAALTVSTLLLCWGRLHVGGYDTTLEFSPQNNPAAHCESLQTRVLTYNYLLAVNLGKLVWPSKGNLCCDWSRQSIPLVQSPWDPRNAFTLIFWLLAAYQAGSTLLALFRRRAQAMGQVAVLAFAALPFLPASNLLFPVGFVVAERVLYTPSMGFCLFLAQAVITQDLAQLLEAELFPPPTHSSLPVGEGEEGESPSGSNTTTTSLVNKHGKRGGEGAHPTTPSQVRIPTAWKGVLEMTLLMLILAGYSGTTVLRNLDWLHPENLWASGVQVNPRNGMLWYNLGHELEDRGDIPNAWRCFETATLRDPLASDANTMLGVMAMRANQLDLAGVKFRRAIDGNAPSATAHHNYAMLLLRNHSLEDAVSHLRAAVRLAPTLAQAHELLGHAYLEQGRKGDATESFAAALRLNPQNEALLDKLQEVHQTHRGGGMSEEEGATSTTTGEKRKKRRKRRSGSG